MSQYVEGGAVAPRPVLEIIKQPLYDTVQIATGATTASFFSMPVGAADAGAAVGVKTFSETNLRRAGALATPQQFDIYAISLKYPAAITRADHTAFQNGAAATQAGANYNLEVGQKSYLRVKLTTIPQDTAQNVDALAVAGGAGSRTGGSGRAATGARHSVPAAGPPCGAHRARPARRTPDPRA